MKQSYYLHAYARGVDKRIIFKESADYSRFFFSLSIALRPKTPRPSVLVKPTPKNTAENDYSSKYLNKRYGSPKITILSAVLMPNHFHLHAKFTNPSHCSRVFQRLLGGYTRYFNQKYHREGTLFSSKIKKVPILSDEQNIYITKYIHLNPIKSSSLKHPLYRIENYPWSTYPQYVGKPSVFTINEKLTLDTSHFCNPKSILDHFSDIQDYRKFIFSKDSQNSQKNLLNQKQLIDQSYPSRSWNY